MVEIWNFIDGLQISTKEIIPILAVMFVIILLCVLMVVYLMRMYKKQNKYEEIRTKESWFERNFSLLLEQHDRLLYRVKNSEVIQREIKRVLYEDYDKNKLLTSESLNTICEKVRKIPALNTYFRVLFHLINFIDQKHPENLSKKTAKNIQSRKFYTDIVRSFIDDETLLLLAVSTVKVMEEHTEEDERVILKYTQYKKYKELMAKYAFLEHIDLQKSMVDGAAKRINERIDCQIKEQEKSLESKQLLFTYNNVYWMLGIFIFYPANCFGNNLFYRDFKNKLKPTAKHLLENILERGY